MHTKFWQKSLKEGGYYEDHDSWMDNIKMDLTEVGVVWTGLKYLRIVTSGGL
jgi:hypothetical protein